MSGLQKTEIGRRAFLGARESSQEWESSQGACLGQISNLIWSVRKTSLKTAIESQMVKDIINRNIITFSWLSLYPSYIEMYKYNVD